MITHCGRNKKGGSVVFLCMILSALLLLVGLLGEIAAGMVSRPYVDAVFDLAGRSVLSEYDRILQSRYGLFGFLLDEEAIGKKIEEYSEASFITGRGKTSLLPLEIDRIDVDCSEYTLTNPDLLEQQIIDLMDFEIVYEAQRVLDIFRNRENSEENSPGESDSDVKEKKENRRLRNGKVIEQLPSRSMPDMAGGLKSILNLPKPDKMGSIAYNEICLNLYILKYFRHDLDSPQWGETFFNDEIEYILCGRLSDEVNHEITYLSLLAFRTTVNAAHIYADGDKWAAVTAAAAIAGGGVATAAAQASITAIWAGAEAANDMKRLNCGERVPLIKTSEDWVLGIDIALDGNVESTVTTPESHKGLNYEDYLFLLLCFKGRESKLIRIMDLIQINIVGSHDRNFSMSGCIAGFRFRSEVVKRARFPGIMPTRKGEFSGIHVY